MSPTLSAKCVDPQCWRVGMVTVEEIQIQRVVADGDLDGLLSARF